MEVGARDAPTARHVLALMSNTSLESVAPMASGTSEPKNATCTPLAPTNDSDARSTSTPASKTMSTRPNSPTIISASGFGAMFMPWGPTAMPARISPTNWGWRTWETGRSVRRLGRRERGEWARFVIRAGRSRGGGRAPMEARAVRRTCRRPRI